jgi:hypothetical protein
MTMKRRVALIPAVAAMAMTALAVGPPAALAAPVALAPTADTFVDASLPGANYGSNVKLRTDGSPTVRSYLRFDVTGWSPGSSTATLRLMPTSSLATGLDVTRVASTTWSETSTTFANAPPLGSSIATTTPPRAGTWLAVDVTAAIAGNGPVSLGVASASTTAEALASREAGAATAPQLVIDTTGADVTPPAPALTAPADGATVSASTPTFSGIAGTASGDESTVAVLIWPGTDTSGPPQQSLAAAALAGGSFSVAPSSPLADGPYSVAVEQRDASGNVGRSATRTFTVDTSSPPPPPATLTPVADSYVDASQPGANFGTSAKLRTDGSPVVRSYLRFDVTGWSPGTSKATLRLVPTSSITTGLTVARVASTSWGETAITAANAPAPGAAVATTAPPRAGVPLTVDVTAAIDGNGPTSLALSSNDSAAEALASRESGANSPQLILESTDEGPDVTAPVVSLTRPAAGSTTSDATPTLAGRAGTTAGDSSSVRVRVWPGSDTNGAPAADLTTTRAGDGSFSVDVPDALPDGPYTARADQEDAAGNVGTSTAVAFTVSQAAADPTIAAAGDIACAPGTSGGTSCRQVATSDLLLQLGPQAVLALGDTQYESGEYPNYLSMFEPSWGRVKDDLHPVIGNHEYGTSTNSGCDVNIAGDPRSYACGYFDYFNGKGNLGGRGGQRGQGYYAFDVGEWRIYALNSNCGRSGAPSCAESGAMVQWLRADLAANPRACQVMFMHHPMFSSDTRNYDTAGYRATMRPMWDAFDQAGGDVVLAGHSHFYERFAPMTPAGVLDMSGGIQQFIVGTGGRNLQPPGPNTEPNRVVQSSAAFGVLEMELHPGSYDWRFRPIAGQTFTDAGQRDCH